MDLNQKDDKNQVDDLTTESLLLHQILENTKFSFRSFNTLINKTFL